MIAFVASKPFYKKTYEFDTVYLRQNS